MSFSYDLGNDIGKLRLEIGDTVAGVGPRPDGTNLSDEELQVWLTREGTVGRAAAAACEALARAWSSIADTSVGPRSESASQVAEAWRTRAAELRQVHGYPLGMLDAAGAVVIVHEAKAGVTDEWT